MNHEPVILTDAEYKTLVAQIDQQYHERSSQFYEGKRPMQKTNWSWCLKHRLNPGIDKGLFEMATLFSGGRLFCTHQEYWRALEPLARDIMASKIMTINEIAHNGYGIRVHFELDFRQKSLPSDDHKIRILHIIRELVKEVFPNRDCRMYIAAQDPKIKYKAKGGDPVIAVGLHVVFPLLVVDSHMLRSMNMTLDHRITQEFPFYNDVVDYQSVRSQSANLRLIYCHKLDPCVTCKAAQLHDKNPEGKSKPLRAAGVPPPPPAPLPSGPLSSPAALDSCAKKPATKTKKKTTPITRRGAEKKKQEFYSLTGSRNLTHLIYLRGNNAWQAKARLKDASDGFDGVKGETFDEDDDHGIEFHIPSDLIHTVDQMLHSCQSCYNGRQVNPYVYIPWASIDHDGTRHRLSSDTYEQVLTNLQMFSIHPDPTTTHVLNDGFVESKDWVKSVLDQKPAGHVLFRAERSVIRRVYSIKDGVQIRPRNHPKLYAHVKRILNKIEPYGLIRAQSMLYNEKRNELHVDVTGGNQRYCPLIRDKHDSNRVFFTFFDCMRKIRITCYSAKCRGKCRYARNKHRTRTKRAKKKQGDRIVAKFVDEPSISTKSLQDLASFEITQQELDIVRNNMTFSVQAEDHTELLNILNLSFNLSVSNKKLRLGRILTPPQHQPSTAKRPAPPLTNKKKQPPKKKAKPNPKTQTAAERKLARRKEYMQKLEQYKTLSQEKQI